jgi:hypothetical protein
MLEQSIPFVAIAIMVSAVFMPTAELYAGNEWNDRCYDAGLSDGQNEPFNHATYDHCGDEPGGADAYYEGFIDGCLAVEDNTRDVCESGTDS